MAELEMSTMFIPHSSAGYYAANNQFQIRGPRGFIEFKPLENNRLHVRVDLPGIGDGDEVKVWTNRDDNEVLFGVTVPKEFNHDESERVYQGRTGVICECCRIDSFQQYLKDGVLGLRLQKVKINKDGTSKKKIKEDGKSCKKIPHSFSGGSQSSDGAQSSDGSSRVLQDHPYVIKGSKDAFEAKLIEDGGIYGRIDMPGVAKRDARVFFEDGEVRFLGIARGISGYTTDREYRGSVALPNTYKFDKIDIQHEMKNGILRITISRK